jgi:hypothetical protein
LQRRWRRACLRGHGLGRGRAGRYPVDHFGETPTDLNNSTAGMDATLALFNDTITRIDELSPRLTGVVDRPECLADPVKRIVGAVSQ